MSAGPHSFPEALGANLFPWPFQLLRGCLHSLFHGLVLHLQSQQVKFLSHCITDLFCLPLLLLKTLINTFVLLFPYFKVNWLATLIPSATVIPLCHVIKRLQRFQGLRSRHLWGTIRLPTQPLSSATETNNDLDWEDSSNLNFRALLLHDRQVL